MMVRIQSRRNTRITDVITIGHTNDTVSEYRAYISIKKSLLKAEREFEKASKDVPTGRDLVVVLPRNSMLFWCPAAEFTGAKSFPAM